MGIKMFCMDYVLVTLSVAMRLCSDRRNMWKKVYSGSLAEGVEHNSTDVTVGKT